ncbi:MAG: Ig-like domain-containing protein [Euryarchaeota archaeon]|nr:Ig-like domain-containing protein [Euryarchaeota archaeon]
MKAKNREIRAFVIVLTALLMVTSLTPLVMSMEVNIQTSSAQPVYAPNYPSMLKVWSTISLGTNAFKPVAYGKYVVVPIAERDNPTSIGISIYDITSEKELVYLSINLPSYVYLRNGVLRDIEASWFSWKYLNNKILGVVLVLYYSSSSGEFSHIISIPDVFGKAIGSISYNIPVIGSVKGYTIHSNVIYVLESAKVGVYSLRAVNLINGGVLWTYRNSEFTVPDWKLILEHFENLSSISGQKNPQDLYDNYAVIYKPLFEALYKIRHTLIYSYGRLYVFLPFGPILVIDASTGKGLVNDDKITTDHYALSTNVTEGLLRDILYPIGCEYYSGDKVTGIVAFYLGTEYGDIVKKYLESNTGLPVGKLSSVPKVVVYPPNSTDLDPNDYVNVSVTLEGVSDISTSVLVMDPLASFYSVRYSLSVVVSQALLYNYSWILGVPQYVAESEKDLEDKILDVSFDVVNMVYETDLYVVSGIDPHSLAIASTSLPVAQYIKDSVHFKALAYALPYYSNKDVMEVNFTDLVLVITNAGLYAYGVRNSTEGYQAEPALIWVWEGSRPDGVVPIENVLWGIYEREGNDYKLLIVSPVYIKAGDSMIGYYNKTLNVVYAGFSFFDYLTGTWDPYFPRHLLAHIYYITPSGHVYSLKTNTTILLDYPGMNTVRAVLYFNNETTTPTNEDLSHKRLTEILLYNSVADEAFFDVYVLSKNYWPSKYGGIEGYNYAYATLPDISMLGVIGISGIQGVQNIVSLQTLNAVMYVVTTDGSTTKVYRLSPSLVVEDSLSFSGRAISSAIFRDKLYVLSKEGDFNYVLYEISNNTAEVLTRLVWPSENTFLSVSPGGIYVIDKEQGIVAKMNECGRVLWTKRLFSKIASYSYGFGALYLYTVDGKVFAVDDSSGVVTWYRDVGSAGEILYALIPKNETSYGTSYVLVLTEDGTVYALSPENGNILLKKNVFLYSEHSERLISDTAYAPAKTTVYFVTNYAVYALDSRSLQTSIIMPLSDVTASSSSMILATDDRVTVLFPDGDIVTIGLGSDGYVYKTLSTGIRDIQDIAVAEPFIVFANRTGVFAIGIQPLHIIAAYPENLVSEVGKNITIVLKAYDLYGNPLPNATINVTKPYDLTMYPANVTTDENGTAVITFTSVKAGTYPIEVSLSVGGKAFTVKRTLVFVHAAPSTIEVNITPEEITTGEYATVTVTVYDEYGNPVPGVTLEASAVYGTISPQTTKTDPSGKATFVYTSKVAGSDSITIRAPDYGISVAKVIKVNPGSPYKITIKAPSEVALGETFIAEITVYDMYGNPVLPGYELNVYINDNFVKTISTGTGGKAFFQYKFTTFGTFTVRVEWKEDPTVYDVTVVSVVSGVPATIRIEHITSEIKAGQYLEATIAVYDKYNNPAPGVNLDVYIDSVAIGTFTTDIDGKINLKVQMTKAGTHTLKVVITGMPSVYKEATFTVKPSDQIKLSVTLSKKELTAGETLTITMMITDIYGNPVSKSLKVTVGESSEYVLVSSEPTKYSVVVTKAGDIPVRVEYNGKVLFEDKIKVYPGEPSQIVSNASITVRAGEQFTLIVQVLDAYGNPVPGVSLTIRDISGVAPSYTKTVVTNDNGVATLKDSLTLAKSYKLEIFVTDKPSVKFIVDLTVTPASVTKVMYVGPDVIYAGEYTSVVFMAFDGYANPVYNAEYSIEAPNGLTVKQTLTRTTGNGSILLTVYTEKAGDYTLKVKFPSYNKTFEVKITVTPSLDRTIILKLDKTRVKPGEDITVTFTIKDKFGNPIVDELPKIRIRGLQAFIKTFLPTDATGTGILVFTPQERGFGKVWAEYMGKQTEPIEFISGNPTLLKIVSFAKTYWYVLLIVAIIAVIAGLFIAYLRTIGRMRRMI